MSLSFKYSVLCKIIWDRDSPKKTKTTNFADEIMKNILSNRSFTTSQIKIIRTKLMKSFIPQFNRNWQKVSRKIDEFRIKFADFLQRDFVVDFSNESLDKATNNKSVNNQINIHGRKDGRPCLKPGVGSESTKRRRIIELTSTCSKDNLSRALGLKRKLPMSDLEDEISDEDEMFDDLDKTLAMYVDINSSKRKYAKLRKHNDRLKFDQNYASYEKLSVPRKASFPENIEVSPTGATVNFISMLEHTTKRILMILGRRKVKSLQGKELKLKGKWGMDGASGQQTTRQKWSDANGTIMEIDPENEENEDDEQKSDASVFILCFSPLQLIAGTEVIWQNEAPNSPHYCRVFEFHFRKENDLLVKEKYNQINNILKKVQVYELYIEKMQFDLKFDLKCTMIDGKTCNVLCGQKASSCCNICGVGPKFVNDLDKLKNRPCNEDFYKFGLSTLHCWIRSMEYFLHIAYNIDFKKGSARGKEHKELKKKRKRLIQNSLKKISIPVDIVKQGAGTSNTGNVARCFFAKSKLVAKATGLDKTLINRLHNILQVMTCGKLINSEKFQGYCLETMKLCIKLYPWYKLPPSVHKFLQHGSEIVEALELPLGWLSEEPLEANNKILRWARLHNSRMCSRTATNKDMIHYLLVASDPLISSLRIKENQKISPLTREAQSMLL